MAIRFSGFDETVKGSTGMGPKRRICEEPVLAADHERPDGILNRVVVWAKVRLFQVPSQERPLREHVRQSPPKVETGSDLADMRLHP